LFALVTKEKNKIWLRVFWMALNSVNWVWIWKYAQSMVILKKGPTKENDCSWLVANSDWFRWWYLNIVSQFVLSIFSPPRNYWHSYDEVFLVRILWWCQTSETSDHSENNLAKFGYILDTKVIKKNLFIFLATY
jgi:hypothetical protein